MSAKTLRNKWQEICDDPAKQDGWDAFIEIGELLEAEQKAQKKVFPTIRDALKEYRKRFAFEANVGKRFGAFNPHEETCMKMVAKIDAAELAVK